MLRRYTVAENSQVIYGCSQTFRNILVSTYCFYESHLVFIDLAPPTTPKKKMYDEDCLWRCNHTAMIVPDRNIGIVIGATRANDSEGGGG